MPNITVKTPVPSMPARERKRGNEAGVISTQASLRANGRVGRHTCVVGVVTHDVVASVKT
eukprot:359032-Chlamydomonas_euryale.AAC.4